MGKSLVLLVLLLCAYPAPAFAQPSAQDRADQALIISGVGLAGIAAGSTAVCLEAKTCRELNPLIRRWFGDGAPVEKALLLKGLANGGAYYGIWRFTDQHRKWRTILLASMTAINAVDVVHDLRKARERNAR